MGCYVFPPLMAQTSRAASLEPVFLVEDEHFQYWSQISAPRFSTVCIAPSLAAQDAGQH
jgi:hypothetical protein